VPSVESLKRLVFQKYFAPLGQALYFWLLFQVIFSALVPSELN
jgi:hypothetical protein